MKARDPKTIGMVTVSIGLLLAALVSFFTIDAPDPGRGQTVKLALVIGLVVAAAVVLAIGLSTSVSRARRALRRAEAVAIDAAPIGEVVKLVGMVELVEPLEAPLTGRPCAYFRASVRQNLAPRQINATPFEPLVVERGVDFLLVDGSARALVRMDEAVVAVTRDRSCNERGIDHSKQEALVRGAGRGLAPGLEFTEGVLEPGERIAVLGRIERAADASHAIAVGAPAGGQVRVSDDPALL